MKPARLWVTRTQPQAEATAARLKALGFEPVVRPVLEIQPISDAELDLTGADALAFTSQAAVSAFAALSDRRDLRVFCVGAATMDAARAAGFSTLGPAPERGDVQGLAAAIAAAQPRPAMVFNPAAEEPAANLAELLQALGITARSAPVYRTVRTAIEAVPPDLDGVLAHSAKAAEIIAELIGPDAAPALAAYALSDAIATALRQRGFGRILVAERPDEASLLERIKIDQRA